MPRLLTLVFALAFTVPTFAQRTPEQALASMKPGEGLQVELFAAEPMVINPTNMDIDPLGRVWVTEAVNYRCKLRGRPLYRPEGDRVVILVDKDGDGKADEAITFYQGKELQAPLGICIIPFTNKDAKNGIGYRVLVSQSPDILEFWDKDGDGKADGPPTVFLTGFGGVDHDHGVHSIQVGPDGKFYFTVGDQGVKNLQSKNRKGKKWSSNDTDCQKGTVWRCDPDGNNLELIAHNFRNQYEACVDSFGEIWLSDNDDDGNQQTRICHVLPGGNYGYGPRGPGQSHWHEEQPGIVHKTLRTGFGSPTGICFYEGTLLPKQYQGELIHADAGPREIRSFKRKPKGAGYELEKALMLTSSDNWFRPSDVCVAPDGSVFVADWYDPGVGGHGMGDWTRGRIYRLTPTGHKGYKVPAVKLDTVEGVYDSLSSPCIATRVNAVPAVHKIHEEATRDNFNLLWQDRIKTYTGSLVGYRIQWIMTPHRRQFFTYAKYGHFAGYPIELGPNSNLFDDYTQSVNLRRYLWIFGTKTMPDDMLGELQKDVKDPDYGLHYLAEILLFSQYLPAPEAQSLIFPLAKRYDGQDIFYRAALNIACGTDPVRRDAILADFEKHFPEWNDTVADLVWELRPKSVLPRLEKLLADAKLTAMQKARIVDILAASDDPATGKTVLALLKGNHPAEVKLRAVENLKLFLPTKWKELHKGQELRAAIDMLLKSKDMQMAGLAIATVAPDCTQTGDVFKLAENKAATMPVRLEAVRMIGRLDHVKFFHMVEKLAADPDLASTAITSMGNYVGAKGDNSGAKEALAYLQQALAEDKQPVEQRRAALNALAGTRAGTGALLKMQEEKKLPSALVAEAGRLLRNSPFQGERNKALMLFPAPGKLDIAKLPTPAVLALKAGNADHGKEILALSYKGETQCLKCHAVRGSGGQIGPDLSMIGKKGSKENIFESILMPSKAIADQYVQWKVDTNDGQSVVGLLVEESATGVTLRDANGKDSTFAAKNIESKRKLTTSIMPDDVIKTLTEDDLIDLVAYLATLQTPAYTPTTWAVAGPMMDNTNAVTLIKNNPELKVLPAPARLNANGLVELPGTNKKVPVLSSGSTTVESPLDQKAALLFGNTGVAKVWVNDVLVHEVKTPRDDAKPEQDRVNVKLKKGSNTIVVKCAQDSGNPAFYFTLTSEQELKGK